jgi:predicted nucleic acid-binding protein
MDEGVLEFLVTTEPTALYISRISLGELWRGVAQLRPIDTAAAGALAGWVYGLEFTFADRILGMDVAAAKRWGEWCAMRRRPVMETLLEASASVRGMTFVTRSAGRVGGMEVAVLDPWKGRVAV